MKHNYQELCSAALISGCNLKAPVNTISKRNGLRRLVAVYIDNEVLFYATCSVSCYPADFKPLSHIEEQQLRWGIMNELHNVDWGTIFGNDNMFFCLRLAAFRLSYYFSNVFSKTQRVIKNFFAAYLLLQQTRRTWYWAYATKPQPCLFHCLGSSYYFATNYKQSQVPCWEHFQQHLDQSWLS